MRKKAKKNPIQTIEKFTPSTSTSIGSQISEEAVDLLQNCIRFNTTNPPGNELELAKYLEEVFSSKGVEFIKTKIIETKPGRGNLIVTVSGSDPDNYPCWGFASHLDVVSPDSPDNWKFPPFSGERVKDKVNEFIWGRGTLDTKYVGVSHAIALFTLLKEGFRPKGDIKIIFEADEESGGKDGMAVLIDKYWNGVKTDVLISEGGGFQLPIGNSFVIQRAERGKYQADISVKGTSGHGSTPGRYSDFAIYKMIYLLERLRKKLKTRNKIYFTNEYYDTIEALPIPGVLKYIMKKKGIFSFILKIVMKLSKQPLEKMILPLISDSISPTIIRAGSKENVISPHASFTLDIRTLPSHDNDFLLNHLEEIFGRKLSNYSDNNTNKESSNNSDSNNDGESNINSDTDNNDADEIRINIIKTMEATTSPINTPYYDTIKETLLEMIPDANLIPMLGVAGTDLKYFRLKGVPSYGFSLLVKDEELTYSELSSLIHAPNERISVKNLMLATEYIYRLMKKI